HLQQREHPAVVMGDDLGDEPGRPAGDGDEDVGRLVGEVERAGDDVPVGGDDQPGGRADAAADRGAGRPAGPCRRRDDHLDAAGRLDLDDARGDAGGRLLHRLLDRLVEVRGGRRPGDDCERDGGWVPSVSSIVCRASPRRTSSRTVVPGRVFALRYASNALMLTIGSPSTKLIRSSGLSPALSAGEPGITSSMYAGVRSRMFGTN